LEPTPLDLPKPGHDQTRQGSLWQILCLVGGSNACFIVLGDSTGDSTVTQ
jgi:hypothetical protein